MKFYVYVLKSHKTGGLYIGHTEDIEKRLVEHNESRCRFTKASKPWKIVHHEEFSSRSKAVLQERFYKSGVGRKILKDLLRKE